MKGVIEVKRFLSIVVVMCCLLFFSVALAQASDLEFEVKSATVVDSVDTDLSLMATRGILMELKVVNKGDEVKLWPSDLSIGINNGTEEVRIPGFLLTNAVSDPEDDMGFRYFQGTSIRKGTRHFKVFFAELMNWQFISVLQSVQVEEAVLYFATPASGTFPVTYSIEAENEY